MFAGDFALADALIAEADSIMAATGDAPMSHAPLRLVRADGRRRRGADHGEHPRGDRTRRGRPRPARRGRGGDAVRRPRPLRRRADMGTARGRTQPPGLLHDRASGPGGGRGPVRRARRWRDAPSTALREKTEASRTAWARGVEARSRALLSEGDDADALYRQAISQLAESRLGVELARAQLLYGEWLRRRRPPRRRSRAAARGARGVRGRWGRRRSPNGLRASCWPPGRRCASARSRRCDDLTPQEAQIARLAADGLHECGDRRPAVPEPAHGRVAPAQGLRKARHQLAQGAPLGAARRPRSRPRIAAPGHRSTGRVGPPVERTLGANRGENCERKSGQLRATQIA